LTPGITEEDVEEMLLRTPESEEQVCETQKGDTSTPVAEPSTTFSTRPRSEVDYEVELTALVRKTEAILDMDECPTSVSIA